MRSTYLIARGHIVSSGPASGSCRACGRQDRGQRFVDWVKPTFTDFDKLQPGEIVCNACLFCFDDANAELTRRVKKDKPQRFRNYSHFVLRDEWIPVGKGDKRRMSELLLADPEVAIIAVSGQRHLGFRCPPGWWQIEEQTARPFPRELGGDLELCAELYQGGFSKSEIDSGRYLARRIAEFGFAGWQKLESRIKPLRGSLRLRLALFLVQRNGEAEDGDPGDR